MNAWMYEAEEGGLCPSDKLGEDEADSGGEERESRRRSAVTKRTMEK